MRRQYLLYIVLLHFSGMNIAGAQEYWKSMERRPATLGVEKGYVETGTSTFRLRLLKTSQTVTGLSPAGEESFDFTPGERLDIRDKDSAYHLGDINFSLKMPQGRWQHYATAWKRKPVKSLPAEGPVLAAADLTPALPAGVPLRIKRYYEDRDGDLVLRFVITNTSGKSVEMGAFGVPLVFNNILEGKSLDKAHADNVFSDPYIGMDAGYLEVKRLSGKGSALLVLPEKNMPFEAYRPLPDDPTPRSIVFEGFHEWMALSRAYADTEWQGAEQWNTPRSMTLQPGKDYEFALRLVLAEDLRAAEQTLENYGKPVAIGIPGYVLPEDVEGKLYLRSAVPVKQLETEPEGKLTVRKKGTVNGYTEYRVKGKTWGRSRLRITYEDGSVQTVNYKVIAPEKEVVAALGHFLTTEQWLDDPGDPFGRSPSVISYDYETRSRVTQDSRAWIAGLSDEGGAGSWLAAVMKQLVQPDKKEMEKLSRFVHQTLWGRIQYNEGSRKYGVRKSVFFYEPDSMPSGTYSDTINYKTWAAWDKKHAADPGRSYNYPHVTAAWWVMYRLARYHQGLVEEKPWKWYLEQAYRTSLAMTSLAPHYAQFGQMEGTVFLLVLKDLQREGMDKEARELEKEMKKRAEHWASLNYPFGSEMPWDSTGQEEVFMWSDYFGFDRKADVTLSAILAYMPVMPHWAYNGNARRYWDFLYGGKLSRIERQIHHYGSALNAIPVLQAYRNTPDNFRLLRIGYGGVMGGIANITRDGFGPAAFHSFPSTLDIDYLSGDYGSGFFGYAVNSATFIAKTDDLGWLAFGGNLKQKGKKIEVSLTTAARNRIFLAPEKLAVSLDAGTVNKVDWDTGKRVLTLHLDPAGEYTSYAYLRIDREVELPYEMVNGAYRIPLSGRVQEVRVVL
ncbi:DUF5695 domain-containing protein [Sinomicrobium soli]|uniref:DUF5695 domain-containing protein n=1 Tax=Sinomicrobium sp. N-1-3-6 TaxID=2219864 RepID=UPI000DCE90A0|nr:DUF5695 domain-containing protein [Sinomicrobium sp. N-1-3-6]RAV27630.1 hypothetical protein DN748_17745 [Sinomicrobium sp. N-1-3-6]